MSLLDDVAAVVNFLVQAFLILTAVVFWTHNRKAKP